MSEITITGAEHFTEEVLKSDKPVLVDFWARWCGPCRMIMPALEQLAVKYADRLKVAKVNVDDNPDVAGMFGVSSIPTLMLFSKGEVVAQKVGAVSLAVIESFIAQVL